jgi:hypothetical protein
LLVGTIDEIPAFLDECVEISPQEPDASGCQLDFGDLSGLSEFIEGGATHPQVSLRGGEIKESNVIVFIGGFHLQSAPIIGVMYIRS